MSSRISRRAQHRDAERRVRHRPDVPEVPGLGVLGPSEQHTRSSTLVGWVDAHAGLIDARIARALDAAGEHAGPQAAVALGAEEGRQ